MPLFDLAILFVVLGLGATLQTAVGFGIGIVCVPLLLWAGWSLPAAIATVVGAGFVQSGLGVFKTRHAPLPAASAKVALGQWLLAPVGVMSMALLLSLGPTTVKQCVGVALALVLTLRLFRPAPKRALAAGWAYLAGATGGFLAGLVGMGGPPIVLFAMAQDWDKGTFRRFLWLQFLLGMPIVLTALVLRVGPEILGDFATALGFAPAIWLGSLAGLRLTRERSAGQLKLAAALLLYTVAGASLLGPRLGS